MRARVRRLIGFILSGLVVSVLVCALGTAGAQAPAVSGEVKIGVQYPLSGPFAVNGLATKIGTDLAAEIVNGSYDLNLPLAKTQGLPNLGGARLRLIYADHQSNPQKGLMDAERLISEDRVAALLGAWNSGVTATASQAAERLGVPYYVDISSAESLGRRGFKWFFRQTPNDDDFAHNYFQFLMDLEKKANLPVRRIAQLNETAQRGVETAAAQRKYASKYGFQMLADVSYSVETPELTAEVQKLRAANPDVILASLASDSHCPIFLRTSRNLDFNPKTVFVIGNACTVPNFINAAGKDAELTLSREVFTLDIAQQRPLVKAVNDLYRQRSGGNDMTAESARGFMGVIVLADAINRAASTDPAKIRAALLQTNIPPDQIIMPWRGIKFDPQTGENPLGNGMIVQVQGGRWRAVWPFEIAPVPVQPWRNWKDR